MHFTRIFKLILTTFAILFAHDAAMAQCECPPLVTPECPSNIAVSGCIGQAQIDASFADWSASFESNVSGGCAPVIIYTVNGTGAYTQSELVTVIAGVTPDECIGGSVIVECIVSDSCETVLSCFSSFVVEAPATIGVLVCPTPEPITSCIGQPAIDMAFQDWANSFPSNVSGGCSPVITYSVNSTGTYTQSELAAAVASVTPENCVGGSVIIECTLTDLCGVQICTSTFTVTTPSILMNASVYLQGAMNGDTTGMDANINALLPLTQPYAVSPFNHSGTENLPGLTPDVVDWIMIELRDPGTDVVIESRAALLLESGEIVDLDGASDLSFQSAPDFYKVAIRHRNHLDIMSEFPLDLTAGFGGCDFTSGCAPAEGMKDFGNGVYAMLMGDVDGNQSISYNGQSNDKNAILAEVGLNTPNNIILGYHLEDVNMQGAVLYNGASNDKNAVLSVIGLNAPNNIIFGHLH